MPDNENPETDDVEGHLRKPKAVEDTDDVEGHLRAGALGGSEDAASGLHRDL